LLVEVVQQHLWLVATLDLDDDADTLAARFVADVAVDGRSINF
jgi:hypothetical protein